MIWSALLVAAAITTAPPARIDPPPPLPVAPIGDAPVGRQWALGYDAPPPDVSCDGSRVAVRSAEAPPVLTSRWYGDKTQPVHPAFDFRIDPTGRPLGIALAPTTLGGAPLPDVEALQATLSTWTFAAPPEGAAGCRVVFPGAWTLLTEAPPTVVDRLIAQQSLPAEDLRNLRRRAGQGDCQGDEPPFPRVLHYPRYERVPKQPGRPGWVVVKFDIDGRGKPRKVRKLASSGSGVLDQESLTAVARSTFQPKAATGCVSVLRRPPAAIAAPPSPPPASFQRPGDDCPGEDILSYRGAIAYPREFQRRRIEGWAMIRFDVASWGQVGAVQVVASEPTASFGQAALNYVSVARAKHPGKPMVGCIVPVRFKMPELLGDGAAGSESELQFGGR